jgi:ribonuclease HI
MSMVTIYTDGAARGNPGPGGFGVVLQYGPHRKEISQGYKHTTNNRMELMALIVGLEALKKDGLEVTVYTDSKYVMDSIQQKWVFGWQKKDFKGKKNADLWKRFLQVYPKVKLHLKWVKGHAGNRENERCDVLATTAADSSHLLEDIGYEIDQRRFASE